jgi:hypothetical protein
MDVKLSCTLFLVGSVFLAAAGCMPASDTSGGGESAGGSPGTGGGSAAGGSPGGSSGGGGGSSPATGGAGGSGGAGGAATAGTGGSSAAGAGGSSGSGGGGGSTTSADAAPPADQGTAPATDTGPSVPPPGPPGDYACTRLIGINATAEWYGQGFEAIVGNDSWELVRVHSGFVDLWANPGNAFWNTKPTSPCAGGKTPDRVIFIGLRFEWTSTEQWTTALTAVAKNIKDKFPGVKNIELGTFVRAPGNKACPQAAAPRSTIHASQDAAIAAVVATDPALLTASPKFEAASCSEFTGNPPHFSAAGGRAVAMRVGAHYAKKE